MPDPNLRPAEPSFSFGADDPIPLTGERTTPGVPEENYWFQRHVIAYQYAAGLVGGMRVLDAGCGEGYGTAMLAGAAREVIGVDVDTTIVRRAAARYPRAAFESADLVSLPYPDASFGAVVSLQVIEHLPSPQDFLAECRRVLSPDGVLVLSTPNRLTFSPDGLRNPFHTFEFSPAELRAAVAQHFRAVDVRGTFHGYRLAVTERILRRSFPERLLEQPAPEWPQWLRHRVERVRPDDFRIRPDNLDRSLDLIAVARP